jgi:hypothetical protein
MGSRWMACLVGDIRDLLYMHYLAPEYVMGKWGGGNQGIRSPSGEGG